MRIVCFDIGTKRIGVATSDGVIASGLMTYHRKGKHEDYRYLAELLKKEKADRLVLGLPTSLEGEENKMTEYVRLFQKEFAEYTDIDTVFCNEKLTSWEAEQLLIEAGMRREERTKVIDKVAATLILESYLSTIS